MKKWFAFALTILPVLFLAAQKDDFSSGRGDLDAEKLREKIENLMREYRTVGLAVAVVKDSSTIFAEGYGYRNFEEQLPANAQSIFGIGSVSKSFTASILGILAEEDKVNLRDRPEAYLPGLKFYSAVMDSTVQIRHLLSHATGVENLTSETSAVLFSDKNKEVLLDRVSHLKPQTQVGEAFHYSNFNYTLAGIIGERITGSSWNENIQRLLFEPLKMRHSFSSYREARRDPDFSIGYGLRDDSLIQALPQEIPTLAAAGEIHSSVTDIAEWLKVWLNSGRKEGKQILPADYVEAATRAQQIMDGEPRSRASGRSYFHNYGYGWMSSDYYSYYKVEHSGGVSGYTSNVVFFPTENLGIVVLSNQSSSGISFAVSRLLEEELLDIKRASEDTLAVHYSTAYSIASDTVKTVFNPEKPSDYPLQDYVGNYFHPGFGTIEIRLTEGTLIAEFPFIKCRLEHQEGSVFFERFTEDRPLIILGEFMRFDFQPNKEGQISSLFMNFSSDGISFKKQ